MVAILVEQADLVHCRYSNISKQSIGKIYTVNAASAGSIHCAYSLWMCRLVSVAVSSEWCLKPQLQPLSYGNRSEFSIIMVYSSQRKRRTA